MFKLQMFMTRLVTRTQLARVTTRTQLARVTPFIHRSKPLLTTLSSSQTLSFAQFSSKAASHASNASVASDYRPAKLPEELSKNVLVLSCKSTAFGGVCNVYVVGTRHGSKESCRQVQAIVKFLKPQVVFLELCEDREGMLTSKKLEVPTMGEMRRMLKEEDRVCLEYFFTGSKRRQVQSKAEAVPGGEFQVAYEEAIKYGGRVVLGDRPIEITLRRTWSKMPLRNKTKLFCYLLLAPVLLPICLLNRMRKEKDDDDSYTRPPFDEDFPTLRETLVNERDQGVLGWYPGYGSGIDILCISYMSSMLLKLASVNSSVVAVVGKGHLGGIKMHWKQPVVLEDLLAVPSPKPAISAKRIFRVVGVAAAGVAIISGVYLSCKKDFPKRDKDIKKKVDV
ncbi:hypothetical protein VNO77_36822 [Canavalia gladiata]|uniref:TraB domain containing n=1 Tax=Canavalia gladiata TaxID=3824 RepID=A0AAN9K8C1_CANGL